MHKICHRSAQIRARNTPRSRFWPRSDGTNALVKTARHQFRNYMPAGRQLITALPEFIAKKMMDAV
jgi:hypothetical protein